VFAELSRALRDRPGDPPPVHVCAVTVRENDRYAVRYTESPDEEAP
jgi:hypothetical protein